MLGRLVWVWFLDQAGHNRDSVFVNSEINLISFHMS